METITLKHPVEVNGTKVDKVEIRRLTVFDLELSETVGKSNSISKTISLVSSMAEMNPDDVRRMDASDFGKFADAVNVFLG